MLMMLCAITNSYSIWCFFFNYTATTEIYTYGHTLSLHDALPISAGAAMAAMAMAGAIMRQAAPLRLPLSLGFTPPLFNQKLCGRSEEHTSELQSLMRISYAVFCLKKKNLNMSQVSLT